GVRPHEEHVRVVLARHPQRAPAVVDAEGAVAELLEERHPAPGAAARFEDAEPAATEEFTEDRRRHLMLLAGRAVDVVVLAPGRVLRPVLLGVGLVEALGDLFAKELLEAHDSSARSAAAAVASVSWPWGPRWTWAPATSSSTRSGAAPRSAPSGS